MLIRRPQQFHVYAAAGEQVFIKFVRDRRPNSGENSQSGEFRVVLRRPDGTIVPDGSNLAYTCEGAPGTGQPNRANCEVTITALTSGVHTVDFAMLNENSANLSNIGARWTVQAQTSAGKEIPGRVWSEDFLGYQTWTDAAERSRGEDVRLWAYSTSGLVYQVDYLGMYGIDARFLANKAGNEIDCKPLYGSYVPKHEDDPGGTPGLEGLGDGSDCGPLKLFFEKPAADLPAVADSSDSDLVADLPLATEYVAPTLDPIEFTPDGPNTLAGTLKIKTTNFDGPLTVWLDTNGDGTRDREFLVVVNGNGANKTTTEVRIDGNDANGKPIALNQALTIGADIDRVGETHFIRTDIENSSGGIQVSRITGPNPGVQKLHWNDQPMADNIGKTFTVGPTGGPPVTGRYRPCKQNQPLTNPVSSLEGTSSSGGVHKWNLCPAPRNGTQGLEHEWGDIASIDDWVFLAVDLKDQLTIKRAGPKVEKKFVSATDDNNDGIYNVIYDVVVTNEYAAEDTYSLVDSPDFDDDIVINRGQATVSATSGTAPPKPSDFVPDPATDPDNYQWELAKSGTKIAPNSKHTYQLTFEVQTSALRNPSTVYTPCGSATGTADQGLYNHAKLDSAGLTDEAEACGDLTLLTIEKEVGTVTQDPASSDYIARYTVKVTNHGAATQYDLVDEPGFTKPLEIKSATFTSSSTSSGGQDPWTGPTWTLADNKAIGVGASDDYTLSFVVDASKLGQAGQPAYDPCEPSPASGKGLFNSATLTYAKGADKAQACRELSLIQFDKKFVSATDTDGDQIYDVTYTVTVANSGGKDETYTLTDTPTFDDNLTINSGTATASGDGAPSTISDYPTATGVWTLAPADPVVTAPAGKTHTYTLNFKVDATKLFGKFDAEYAECTDENDPTRGLFNTASLTNNGRVTHDRDCGDVPGVVIEKDQPQASDHDGDGIFTVSYRIRVRNIGGAETTYDLDDTPEFDPNFKVTGGTATSDPATTTAIPPYTGTGAWPLVVDRPIPPHETHTYRVEFMADASALETKGVAPTRCGDNPGKGKGLFNRATLTVGVNNYDDSACGNVPMLNIVKSLSNPAVANDVDKDGLVEAGDSLAYTIVVTNTGGVGLSGVTVRDTIIAAEQLACVRTGTSEAFNHIAGDTLAVDASVTCTGEYQVTTSDIDNGKVANTATADSNETPPDDDTEEYALKPQLDIVKESTAAKSLGDGRYEIVSTITVTSANKPTAYDLADALQYGEGVKVIEVNSSNVTPGDIATNQSFDGGVGSGKGDPIIVRGVKIGQNVTHTYQVTVIAEIPPAFSTGSHLECQASGSGRNGGFANTATVTYETVTEKDDSCVAPPQPTLSISKQPVGQARFIERRNNVVEYEVTYDVVATNASAARGIYDLVDDPQFGPGTAIVAATATSADVTLPNPAIWRPETGENTVASGVVINSKSTHRYRLVLRATVVEANLSTTRGDCTGTNSSNETEFFNRADLSVSGTVVDSDDACLPVVPPTPTPSTTPTGEQIPPTPSGNTTTTLPLPGGPAPTTSTLPPTGSSIISDALSYASVLFLSGGALVLLVRRRRQSA